MMLAATAGGMTMTAFPPVALALLSPTARPSAAALSDIPPGYLALYMKAARTCRGLPWPVLAAIGAIESDHGRSSAPDVHGPTGDGAPEGPMQFAPATFAAYAAYAARTGKGQPPSPYNPSDAIYTAARVLCASGAEGGSPAGIARAVYAYNHAGWYVSDVLSLAEKYSGAPVRVMRPRPRPTPTRPAPASSVPAPAGATPTTPGVTQSPGSPPDTPQVPDGIADPSSWLTGQFP